MSLAATFMLDWRGISSVVVDQREGVAVIETLSNVSRVLETFFVYLDAPMGQFNFY